MDHPTPLWSSAHRLARRIRDRVEDVRGMIPGAEARPPRIVPLGSHGSRNLWTVRLRVLEDPRPREADVSDPRWLNAWEMLRRLETDEVAGAGVRISVGSRVIHTTTDGEGAVEVDVPPAGATPIHGVWRTALATLDPAVASEAVPTPTPIPVLVPLEWSDFGVISDVDDTVIRTGARRFLDMAWTTLTGNAATREPFPGVGPFYRALRAGPGGSGQNPFFYVSSSPWGLQEFLMEVLDRRQVPAGPLFLRDLDPQLPFPQGNGARGARGGRHHAHKLRWIEHILERHAGLSFVLLGDSGQHDPEIYAEVVERWPHRIRAVFLRDVTEEARDAEVTRVADRMRDRDVPVVVASRTEGWWRGAAELELCRPA